MVTGAIFPHILAKSKSPNLGPFLKDVTLISLGSHVLCALCLGCFVLRGYMTKAGLHTMSLAASLLRKHRGPFKGHPVPRGIS